MTENQNPLTKREQEILISLSDGRMYKEIAVEYGISIDTVKKHCKNIYKKLAVRNRTEAARFVLNNGKK
jgi:DNA-binding NarL/FixJ family response regulator